MGALPFERITRWIEGRNRPRQGELKLAQRNVYVLPSRAGMLYAMVLLAMLVASINYALSLGFMLTFLLGAVAVVAMLHAFRNLSSLVLRPGRAEPVFAGQPAEFSLQLVNQGGTERFAIRLFAAGMATHEVADVAPGSEQSVRIALPTERRGWLRGSPRHGLDHLSARPLAGLGMVAARDARARLPDPGNARRAAARIGRAGR